MPHDPEVDDAPVGAWEALNNPPSAHAVAVNDIGGGGWNRKRPWVEIWRFRKGFFGGPGARTLPGRLHKGAGLRSQTGSSIHDLDPGSEAEERAARRFLIGEASETAEMMPVGTGRIAAVVAD